MRRFCIYCGSGLYTGARFCAKCGAPVVVPPSHQGQPVLSTPTIGSVRSPQSVPMTPPNRYDAVPASILPTSPMPHPVIKKKPSGLMRAVVVVLLFALVTGVLLYGWPGLAVKERIGKPVSLQLKKSAIENDVADLSGMRIDFSGTTYDEKYLEQAITDAVDLDEGRASTGYDLAFTSLPEGTIILSAPMPVDLSLGTGEQFYLDIGISMLDPAGEEVMVYDHIEASEQAGQIIAEIKPAVYNDTASRVYLSNAGYLQPAYPDKMRFNAQFKVKRVHPSQSERFRLIFDRSKLMRTSVTPDMTESLLARMEQVYSKMNVFGFDMSGREKWPMDLHVTTLYVNSDKKTIAYGQYVSSWLGINHGYINLSRLLFTSFDLTNATSVFAHELMHFIQDCYVHSEYKRLRWLDEATAVFMEHYFGKNAELQARQYEMYEGIYPVADDPDLGYSRGALVNYWAHRGGWLQGEDPLSGTNRMSGLIDLYSTGGYLKGSRWQEWIETLEGNPSGYALDFFTRMLMNDESVWAHNGYAPYILHSVIINKEEKDINAFGVGCDLEASKILSDEGQQCSVKVPAYGARVLAIRMAPGEQDRLVEDAPLVFTSDVGETLVLVRALGSQVEKTEGVSIATPKFRSHLEDKHRYLVLAVNTTDKPKSISFSARMTIEPAAVEEEPDALSIHDVVGSYQGESWDPTEGGAVNEHTFVVSQSGDGLVMSNLEGIQWKYEPASGTATATVDVPEYGLSFTFVFRFVSENGLIRIEGATYADGNTYAMHEYRKLE